MAPEGVAAPARKPSRDATLIKGLGPRTGGGGRSRAARPAPIADLAEQGGVTDAYVCRLLPLLCLARDLSLAAVS